MVRVPCCDKVGVKRGPWTPEEDIMLVTYIQEHGPGNWRAVPTITGLQRCSKSCRLRWTNYLRPGIKRGSFTDHEEKLIIQLQALLGNKWAAIATYLPERTDNDIKNYWNTHLKKKLKKLHEGHDSQFKYGYSTSHSISRGQWEKRLQTDIKKAKQDLCEALSFNNEPNTSSLSELKPNKEYYNSFSGTKLPPSSSSYMSSLDNIAKLLKNWVKNSPKADEETKSESKNNATDASETFGSVFGLDSFGSSNSSTSRDLSPEASVFQGESKLEIGANQVPLAAIENWLFDIEDGFELKEEFDNFSFDPNEDLF